MLYTRLLAVSGTPSPHDIYPSRLHTMPVGPVLPHQELAIRFTGAMCYAFYLVTLGQTLRWQLFTDEGWKLRRNRNNFFLTATLLIFACTTIYLSLGLQKGIAHVYSAVYGRTMPGYIDWGSTIGVSVTVS